MSNQGMPPTPGMYPQGQQPPGPYGPGVPLGQMPPGMVPGMVPQYPAKKNTGLIVGIALLAVLVVALGVALGFFLVKGSDDAAPSKIEETKKPIPTQTSTKPTDVPSPTKGLAKTVMPETEAYVRTAGQLDAMTLTRAQGLQRDEETVLFRSEAGDLVCTMSTRSGDIQMLGDEYAWIMRGVEASVRDDQSDTYMPGVVCHVQIGPNVSERMDASCREGMAVYEEGAPGPVGVGNQVWLTTGRDATSHTEFGSCVDEGYTSVFALDSDPFYGGYIPGEGLDSRLQIPVLPFGEKVALGDYVCGLFVASGPEMVLACADTVAKVSFTLTPDYFDPSHE
ncbi:MAG: hypothetical protein Q4G30_01490 [Actinomycetaceae bacterium]|nr:hypothetical protein [Actinomycetaceae bacterium]